ncbi:MAG: methyl-accepting chemotaxis protein [Spirochaetes bacterium]|jgi:methyl-accepting chemotaxis protein|nr:methyl-accepting chemotaxis protein [Spirochaetota bacterium]
MRFNMHGLKFQIIKNYIILAAIPVIFTFFVTSGMMRTSTRKSFINNSTTSVSLANRTILETVNRYKKDLLLVSRSGALSSDSLYLSYAEKDSPIRETFSTDTVRLKNTISFLTDTKSNIKRIYSVRKNGTVFQYPSDKKRALHANIDSTLFKDAIASSEAIFSEPYLNAEMNIALMTIALKVDDETVLFADIDFNSITGFLESLTFEKSGYLVISKPDGTTIVNHRMPETNFKNISETGISGLEKVADISNDSITGLDEDEQEYLISIMTSREFGWKYVLIVKDSEVVGGVTFVFTLTLFFIFLMVLLFILYGAKSAKTIIDPITTLREYLAAASEGDFHNTMSTKITKRKDVIGELARKYNDFITITRDVIIDVNHSTNQVAYSADEIASAINDFSTNIQNQSANSEEISASVVEMEASMVNVATESETQNNSISFLDKQIKELSTMLHEIQDMTNSTFSLTEKLQSRAATGEETLRTMDHTMDKLINSSQDMVNILAIIDDISEQINLLSLNAAIEAARAGDAGKGFAVVADEISKLADQTAKSLKDIDGLIRMNSTEISDGQKHINETLHLITDFLNGISSINDMNRKISNFMNHYSKTNDEVSQRAEQVQKISEGIKHAADENKRAISEIAGSIFDINDLSQKNATHSQDVSDNTKKLAGMSESLKAKVKFFKV